MEFLIPGLILVALMVYASTRIKRTAAQAFDEETIETEDFVLTKPEGFLHVLNGDRALAFEAYSKEFGKGDASEQRQATIDMRIITDMPFDSVCEKATNGSRNSVRQKDHDVNGMKARSIMAENGNTNFHYLIVDAPGRIFELKTALLKEHEGDYLRKINEMEDSLTIKK